jgi:hypothetical protein
MPNNSRYRLQNTGCDAAACSFIDGGLANNDPSWMGLIMMLLADNREADEASIANTAILSIGKSPTVLFTGMVSVVRCSMKTFNCNYR